MTYKEILDQMYKTPAFIPFLGISITELDSGYCKGEMELKPEHLNPLGIAHGGCVFSLADTIGGLAAISHNPEATVVTVSSNINYLRPAENTTKLVAQSREIKYGSKVAVYEVNVTSDDGMLLASAVNNYFIL